MNFAPSQLKSWLPEKELQLPGIQSLLTHSKADYLIIGAAVFEIYERLGWIPPLKRKTGDIDLSIGLVRNDQDYRDAKAFLIQQKYRPDELHPYRYHSPHPVVGGYTYIDLLAHPSSDEMSEQMAARTMGVGPEFSFEGFEFAEMESFYLLQRVSFPNPFGLMGLKRESYLSEPINRMKDFADIIELVNGLIEKGTHFDMSDLWQKLAHREEAKALRAMIFSASRPDHGGVWEIENIRTELNHRHFLAHDIENTLFQRLRDFCEILA